MLTSVIVFMVLMIIGVAYVIDRRHDHKMHIADIWAMFVLIFITSIRYGVGSDYFKYLEKALAYGNFFSSIKDLFQSGFDYVDIRSNLGKIYKAKKIIVYPYNEIVSEGGPIITTSKTYKRSQRLRNAALDHFSHNGVIECDSCGFEFRDFYGDRFGKPCIEIHHLKPIFQYSGISVSQTIDAALRNLLPVCPNCHRVIHKNNITAAMLPSFKLEIARQHN